MRGELKRISPRLRSFAARLRGDQTDAEQRLWERIRDGQLKGWKFRRQHPIGQNIVDFCCLEEMLIIELNDGQCLKQEEADEAHTNYLTVLGFRILRFWNDDVLAKTDDVLEEIVRVMESSESLHPHPLPGRERENYRQTQNVIEPHRHAAAGLGFRMPAEWERHEATWLGWPHNTKT